MTSPIPQDKTKAWRRLRGAALVIQVEAVILLLSPAIALLVRDGIPNPTPALMALIVAPLLWRLGHGVANASRVAVVIMMTLVAFHILDIITSRVNPLDLLTVMVEVGATIVAVATLLQYQPARVEGWNRQLRWQTVIPIALAVVWQILVSLWLRAGVAVDRTGDYQLAVKGLAALLIGTAMWLIASSGYVPRVASLASARWLPTSPVDVGRRLINWIRSPRLDVVSAVIVGGVSWGTLASFIWLSEQPGMMLVPVFLVVPLAALVGLVMSLLRLFSAWARYSRQVWEGPPRPVAIATSAALGIMLVVATFATLYLFAEP